MDLNVEIAAQLLDVKESVLKEFDVEDTFNCRNRLRGFISRQSDHRYGALVIGEVKGEDVSPQVIYATPKLRYPFGRTELEERRYHFPEADDVRVYEKLDGTNINCYSYADSSGTRFVTFKTRLTPVLRESTFGDFASLWNEMLVEYPSLRCQECVLSGEYTLSYELFGYRNPLLLAYDVPLDARLLFGVRQSDAAVEVPEEFGTELPSLRAEEAYIDLEGDTDFIIDRYNALRAHVDSINVMRDDEQIEGLEGFIFYTRTDGDSGWEMWKAKGESVEAIHWASDFLPPSVIIPTVWNAIEGLDDIDDLNADLIRTLLSEEFTHQQITKSSGRIDKCIALVKARLVFRRKVMGVYVDNGLHFDKDGKANVMRAMSKHFKRDEMKTVFTACREMNLIA